MSSTMQSCLTMPRCVNHCLIVLVYVHSWLGVWTIRQLENTALNRTNDLELVGGGMAVMTCNVA